MKTILIFLILYLSIQVSQTALPYPHIGKDVASEAPKFRLDLNVPPRHRWDHIIPTFKNQIRKFFTNVVDNLPISESFYDKFGNWAQNQFQYQVYVEEIKGIAEICEIDWRKLLLANFSYEISTLPYCTSIVSKNKDNKIIHGRNMDFPFWNFFSKLTASVQFFQGDNYLATLDIQIGSVFGVTGSKPNVLTASIDTRHGPSLKIVWENLLIKNYKPTAFLMREVILESKSYQEGVRNLNSTDITAPVYYIVGGNSDGCVIERNPNSINNYTEINENQWFIVQTNYDRSGPDPQGDNRREPAEKKMEEIGQDNINYDNMYNQILKKFPNLNIETTYTTMMSASLKSHDVSLWYGNITDAKSISNDMYQIMEDQYLQMYYSQYNEQLQDNVSMIEQLLDQILQKQEEIKK